MRASTVATLVACLVVPGGVFGADEEMPDDEFLEFLGAWDEAWSDTCDPEGGLPGDDLCLETEDDKDEDEDDEDNE
ncbi:MAG: hypothetical protein OEQ74_00115 [Gammaproteobacteria bacterium]|nr:hypothetical protein [Gammaproteobacteria bacterium]